MSRPLRSHAAARCRHQLCPRWLWLCLHLLLLLLRLLVRQLLMGELQLQLLA
jgi:hypothetical protein